jgi:hypothetical protein
MGALCARSQDRLAFLLGHPLCLGLCLGDLDDWSQQLQTAFYHPGTIILPLEVTAAAEAASDAARSLAAAASGGGVGEGDSPGQALQPHHATAASSKVGSSWKACQLWGAAVTGCRQAPAPLSLLVDSVTEIALQLCGSSKQANI